LDISNRVRGIVADITNNRLADIDESSGAANADGWDSVAQINIIASIEMEFGLTFSAEEMQSLNSIDKILSAIKERLRIPVSPDGREAHRPRISQDS
jgi:acyl carrier protein